MKNVSGLYKSIFLYAVLVLSLFFNLSTVCAQSYHAALAPLESTFELSDMQYSYNPELQTLTKTYTFTNISGETIENPRLVNLFLWSNNVTSDDWVSMVYDGVDTYANAEQSATVANNDGTIDWSAEVIPSSMSSTAMFPSLPVQTTQGGTSYPQWNIPGYLTAWPDGQSATVQVEFSNVQNSNWIQNMVWIVYSQGPVLIELADFKAVPGDRLVTLVWRTESETKNAGFNLYRSSRAGDERVKINTALIPAQGSPAAGAEYVFADKDVKNGVHYSYTLEDVDVNGESTEHGPAEATPSWIYKLVK